MGRDLPPCPLGGVPFGYRARPTSERMFMNKKERVDVALRGDKVDRVPVGIWRGDYAREWEMPSLMEAMVEGFTENVWDFLKGNPQPTYFDEAGQAR